MQERLYDPVRLERRRQHRQMIFLRGPRQVGKTTAPKGPLVLPAASLLSQLA